MAYRTTKYVRAAPASYTISLTLRIKSMTKLKPYPHNTAYVVSTKGMVWSTKSDIYLKSFPNTSGYLMVDVLKDGKTTTRTVHRMVLETYVCDMPKGMECRHLDGNRTNNSLSNLRWGTKQENMDDMKKHCLENGTATGHSKLTPEDVRLIRKLCKKGLFQRVVGEMFGVGQACISLIVNNKHWKWVK